MIGTSRRAPGTVAGIVIVALFAGAVILGASHSALAQSNAPTTLAPQSLDAAPVDDAASGTGGVIIEEDTGGGAWSTSTTKPSAMIGEGGGSIEVNVLKTLGADMAGVLSGDNGGFQPDLWRGTPRQAVDRLLATMPVHTTSPAMRNLMRRLFLTQAIPPEGNAVDGGFVARRLELLAAMGDVDSVEQLLAITPGRETSPRLIRIETDTHLLHGDFVSACALASGPGQENTDDYWQKLLIFCDVLSGAYAEAQLGLALLREVGVEDETYYLMLDAMMASEIPVVDELSNLNALHVGIIRASRARLAPDSTGVLPPAILSAMADNPDLEMHDRLVAAERAAGTGVLPIEDVRALYDGVVFEETALANPLSAAETLAGPEARALLYQVVSRQTVDGARAEAASLALETAQNTDLYATIAQVFNQVIKLVPPRTDLMWFAGHAVRALVVAGDAQSAAGWLALLRVNALLSDEAALTLAQLTPVVRLAGMADANQFVRTGIDVWRAAEGGKPGAREQAILYYSLLESLGHPVDPPVWDDLGYDELAVADAMDGATQPPDLPDPVLWHRLSGAARSGKIGETALLALATLGGRGTAGAHPVAIAHVVQTLTMIGLNAEARALAVEAALAGGL